MKRRRQIYYSDSQKALMWERWKQGWMLNEFGRLFNGPHTSIQEILVRTGGVQPTARSHASMALSLAEREEISRALVAGESIRSVAALLARANRFAGVSKALVSRILQRAGLSKLTDLCPKEGVQRCERDAPRELLQIDIKKLGRFDKVGQLLCHEASQ